MQDINITPDKVLNSLVYRSPFYVIIYELQTVKNGQIFHGLNGWVFSAQNRFSKLMPRIQTVKNGQIFHGLNGWVFSAQNRFSKLMPRIFKYGDIPNISFTLDKELNILI